METETEWPDDLDATLWWLEVLDLLLAEYDCGEEADETEHTPPAA